MANGRRHLNLLLGLGLCVGAVGGCVHGDSDESGPIIIERSKAQAPTWTEQKPAALEASGGFYRYVHLVPTFNNLPLGIKRAQLLGIVAMKTALKTKLQTGFEEKALASGLAVDDLRATVQTDLAAVVTDHKEHEIRVADIYYEKLRPDLRANVGDEYYRAYVMVQAPDAILEAWSKALGERLQKKRDAGLQAAGRLLSSSPVSDSKARQGH